MTFLLILLATISLIGIGFLVITAGNLLKDESLLARLAYSWGLGVGLIALQMVFYSLVFGGGWTSYELLSPWIIFATIIFARDKRKINFRKMQKKFSKADWLFVLLIFLLIFFVGFESVLRPVPSFDGWSQWLFRSKIFYLNNYFSYQAFWYPQTDYPVVFSLLGTFGFVMMNSINDTNVLFLFFIFYLSLAGVFFSVSRKIFDRTPALILTFLLLSLQNVIRHGGRLEVGDADLALSYYLFASTSLLADFVKTKNFRTLMLLSFFVAITGQIKNDGMPFVVFAILTLLFLILRWKKYFYLLGLLPIAFILLPWEIYKIVAHVPKDIVFVSSIQFHWNQAFGIFLAMCKEFLNFQNWSLLWIVFFFTLILSIRYIKHVKVFLSVFLVQWLSYYAIFMITPREPIGHVNNIIDRLYIHLAPLAVLIIGILINYQIVVMKKSSIWKKFIKV